MVSGREAAKPVTTASAAGVNAASVKAMDDYLSKLVQTEDFRGSVTVARGNEVLLSKGYDLADVKAGSPNTPQTRFRIGSLTKQFTVLAVLKAQELGKLTVNDPVCRHLPSCPAAWKPITIEQLLTHTSGIPDYTDFGDFAATAAVNLSPEKLVGYFRDRPLDFKPGTTWQYSNSGYVLAGYLIERTTGTSYAEFLQQQILEPLGMSDSGYDVNNPITPAHAVGYKDWETLADLLDTSIPYAAGAMFSTTTDMLKWNRFLLTGTPQIVALDTLAELLTPRVPQDAGSPDESDWYAYGVRVINRSADVTYGHSGGINGYRSYNLVKPRQQLSITVLSNTESAQSQGIAEALARLAGS
ncbi:MAG: beta-lactamase [Amycolatopsis sp.]|uniref:serine hydrolase domain-containing protein n=1 Tax=Amycolatopsis sp. TaxID=37632 RepID=UPI0026225394|nr:serine hydrolase domain-containing protein [Amycolatopsis sp.]MCU1681936.1 beta-lactamase [Amycolatopsis sp.]